jgi:hypothetical protein
MSEEININIVEEPVYIATGNVEVVSIDVGIQGPPGPSGGGTSVVSAEEVAINDSGYTITSTGTSDLWFALFDSGLTSDGMVTFPDAISSETRTIWIENDTDFNMNLESNGGVSISSVPAHAIQSFRVLDYGSGNIFWESIQDSGGGSSNQVILTLGDETSTLPNSRRLIAGSNITLDSTVANQLTISSAGGSGGGTEPLLIVEVPTPDSDYILDGSSGRDFYLFMGGEFTNNHRIEFPDPSENGTRTIYVVNQDPNYSIYAVTSSNGTIDTIPPNTTLGFSVIDFTSGVYRWRTISRNAPIGDSHTISLSNYFFCTGTSDTILESDITPGTWLIMVQAVVQSSIDTYFNAIVWDTIAGGSIISSTNTPLIPSSSYGSMHLVGTYLAENNAHIVFQISSSSDTGAIVAPSNQVGDAPATQMVLVKLA